MSGKKSLAVTILLRFELRKDLFFKNMREKGYVKSLHTLQTAKILKITQKRFQTLIHQDKIYS